MSDFVSEFWNVYVALLTIVSILACGVLLWAQSRLKLPITTTATTGHVWDEDLSELNNPLPRWWLWLFYITLIFSIAYLALYPGLGSFAGTLGWSQQKQYEAEVAAADKQYGPIFAKYAAEPLEKVALDPQAAAIGEKLFLNHCAQCHGSDARGAKGFPNLTDRDWQWGAAPDAIKTSIRDGRSGVMPPMAAAVGSESDVRNVAEFVLSLSGSPHDATKAALGKEKFVTCAACHGADGKGNPVLGAPNLTDRIWIYGSGVDAIVEAITKGRSNVMPAHKDFLGEAKVHLLAAYVWRISHPEEVAAGTKAK